VRIKILQSCKEYKEQKYINCNWIDRRIANNFWMACRWNLQLPIYYVLRRF